MQFTTGTNLVELQPLFSHDGRYILIVCETLVRIYSTASCELLRELDSGSGSKIIDVHISKQNVMQLVTVCRNGTRCIWDYEDGILLKSVSLNIQLENYFPAKSADTFYAVELSDECESPLTLRLYKLSPDSNAVDKKKTIMSDVPTDRKLFAFSALPDKEVDYVAVGHGHRLRIYSFINKKNYTHNINNKQCITCVATHPSKACIAIGDNRGQIFLWYNFLSMKPVKSRMHWHSSVVTDLAFTHEGRTLLSVGREGVLVKWRHESNERNFVPRIGAPIVHVAVSSSNSLVATSHDDNGIRLLDASSNLKGVIQGLTRRQLRRQTKRDDTPVNIFPAGILYEPRASCLVLNGIPGHLQFFDHRTNKQLYNLDITGQNTSHLELREENLPVEVQRAALSPCALWLVTWEARRGEHDDLAESRLKFWRRKDDGSGWALHTAVDFPHDDVISALVFRNWGKDAMPMLASTSVDGKFRIWIYSSAVEETRSDLESSGWRCESVGEFRDLPALDADFSHDGSVLALAFGSTVALWDPDTLELVGALNKMGAHNKIRQLRFGGGRSKHLLVSVTEMDLTIWNIVSVSVHYEIQLQISHLAKDPYSNCMAVFSDKSVYVFRPSLPADVLIVNHARAGSVAAALFLPETGRESTSDSYGSCIDGPRLYERQIARIVCIDSDQVLFGVTNSGIDNSSPTENVRISKTLPKSAFAMLLAEKKISQVEADRGNALLNDDSDDEQSADKTGTNTLLENFISTPALLLPPISQTCAKIIGCLMTPAKKKISADVIPRHQTETETDSKEDKKAEDYWTGPIKGVSLDQLATIDLSWLISEDKIMAP